LKYSIAISASVEIAVTKNFFRLKTSKKLSDVLGQGFTTFSLMPSGVYFYE